MQLLLALLIFIGVGIGAVQAARAVRNAVARADDGCDKPKCGNCNYSIANSESGICPECGCRLADVGLRTKDAALKFGGSYNGLFVGWTTLFAIGLVFGSLVAGPNSPLAQALGVPLITYNDYSLTLQTDYNYVFNSNLVQPVNRYNVDIESEFLQGDNGYLAGWSIIHLKELAGSEGDAIRIDHPSGRLTVSNAQGKELFGGLDLDLEQSRAVLRSAIPDIDEQQLDYGSRALMQVVSDLIRVGPSWTAKTPHQIVVGDRVVLSSGSHGWSWGDTPMFSREFGITPTGYIYGTIGIMLMLCYFVGLMLLIRRRWRLLNPVPAT